ncbi:MAG: MarR family transcriptional regulator [Alphaproteobacteria bacterium]|nr:MarR family transcriptional regulator [Alphaproteobacteria bacterium]
MKKNTVPLLREVSRKLVRELGLLNLDALPFKHLTQHWHTLIEIGKKPDINSSEIAALLLLSPSTTSRLITSLCKEDLVSAREGRLDRREKTLALTTKGQEALNYIDAFSDKKIQGAFAFLTEDEQTYILSAINLYANALEKSRKIGDQIKIHTLSTSRTLRRQVVAMIEDIQTHELGLNLPVGLNDSILKAERVYHYKNRTHFWYALDESGKIVGSIGLGFLEDGIGELKKFFVAKEYRRQGLGRRLFATLLKGAKRSGIKTVYLGTVEGLEDARRFYQKVGFSAIAQSTLPLSFSVCPLDTLFFGGQIHQLRV